MTPLEPRAERWLAALATRHRKDLRFAEIRKGVVALSKIYVEERGRIGKDVFSGAGKRAAFACFYTPLHFLLVRRILATLHTGAAPKRVTDLGCGLLAAGAAWATSSAPAPEILGFERHPWAASEARASLRALGLRGRVHASSLERAPRPGGGDAVVAAFAVNELSDDARPELLEKMLSGAARGCSVLVVEPLAKRAIRWWPEWSTRFEALGGRSDEWRFDANLPSFVAELDRAAGLDHRQLSGRSLYLAGRPRSKIVPE